jgi:uncharacterized protein (UPF0335 family)
MLNRKQYEAEVQKKLHALEKEIDDLKDKLKEVEADLTPEHHDRLKELLALKDKIAHKMSELLKSSDEAWEEVQTGLEHYWKAVGNEMKSYDGFLKKKS